MLIQCRRRPSRFFSWCRKLVALAVIGGIAALNACAPRTELWSPEESPKRNRVHWAAFHHNVAFIAKSSQITPAQRRAVSQFLDRIGQGEGVRIALSAHRETPSRLAIRREAALADFLRDHGFAVSLGAQPADGGAQPGSVHVTVGRYIVARPRCPDWSKPATGDPSNRASGNFSCADATNFGLMLADPGVLVSPDRTGPMDGEVAAKSIHDYRRGKAKKAPSITSLVIQSGSGSGE